MNKTLYFYGNAKGLTLFLSNIARDKRITSLNLMIVNK
jgi:hypothetical protein